MEVVTLATVGTPGEEYIHTDGSYRRQTVFHPPGTRIDLPEDEALRLMSQRKPAVCRAEDFDPRVLAAPPPPSRLRDVPPRDTGFDPHRPSPGARR